MQHHLIEGSAVTNSVTDITAERPPGLTITQAAQRLGINRDTIRQRVRRGTLPATKIGKQWYIHLDGPGTASGTIRDVFSPGSPDTGSATVPPTVRDGDPDDTAIVTDTDPDRAARGALATAQAEIARLETTVTILQGQCDQLHELLRAETTQFHELLRGEQEAHRRDVSELHVLLQRAQAQIPMPTLAAQPQEQTTDQPMPQQSRRQRWWWPW